MHPGQYFDNLEDFKLILRAREEEINEKIVIGKSSVSVKAANAKLKKHKYKEELVYTHVTCIDVYMSLMQPQISLNFNFSSQEFWEAHRNFAKAEV